MGDLVSQVNDELLKDLRGPHLQLGPCHFMKKGLDDKKLRRIWKYDIEPFIEDQFFGDLERIKKYQFDNVCRRLKEFVPETMDEDPVDDDPEA